MKALYIYWWMAFQMLSWSCFAQQQEPADSMPDLFFADDGSVLRIDRQALEEFRQMMADSALVPRSGRKPWMEFDMTLPSVPEKRAVMTLHPYKPDTRYDWDPVYQQKIKINKDTWRSVRLVNEAGICYSMSYQAGHGRLPYVKSGGMDLMYVFTREFWNFKSRKRRERTLEVLRSYGCILNANGMKGKADR